MRIPKALLASLLAQIMATARLLIVRALKQDVPSATTASLVPILQPVPLILPLLIPTLMNPSNKLPIMKATPRLSLLA